MHEFINRWNLPSSGEIWNPKFFLPIITDPEYSKKYTPVIGSGVGFEKRVDNL